MIAALLRAIRRRILEGEISSLEQTLAAIESARAADLYDERNIKVDLAKAKRRLRAQFGLQ